MARALSNAAVLGCVLLGGAGCATAPAREPVESLSVYRFARAPEAAPAPKAKAPLRRAETLDSGAAMVRLDAPLVRFAASQRTARLTTKKGEEMSAGARASWTAVLGDVDRFLAQKPERTLPLDLVRARVSLEAELDLDKGHYGDLPPALEASVHARLLSLDQRQAMVRRLAAPARVESAGLLHWPLEPVVMTSPYGQRLDPFTNTYRQHLGVDLQAEVGQLIQAAGPGTVIRAEWAGGHGLHVEVLHEDGTITGYSHMSKLLVTPGIRVPLGGPLGLAGSTGRSTGPHLHFEVWRQGRSVDPLAELMDPAIDEFSVGAMGQGD